MPVKPDEREYRTMSAIAPFADDQDADNFNAMGYATTFDAPYKLFEIDNVCYYEKIDRHALDDADMSDVIMQYDHMGHVLARTSNSTLTLEPDNHGLRVKADLSKTQNARDLLEEIKEGLVTKMSWSFKTEVEEYDTATHTRTIKKIKKVYDVSAVSMPANADTDICARTRDGVIAREEAERLKRRKLQLKIKIETEVKNHALHP